MKFFPTLILYVLRHYTSRRNFSLLLRSVIVFVAFVVVYSVLFHVFMAQEGREYSWVTGVYWTLTVMSTLGFGDITFSSDAGQIFTICVLLSGIVFLLVLLPLLFMEGQSVARVPRELPKDTRGHVVLSHYDAVTSALISRLTQYRYPYVILVSELTEALRLHDMGLKVVLGEVDSPETYRQIRVD